MRNVVESVDWTRLLNVLNIGQRNSNLVLQGRDSHCHDPELGDTMKNIVSLGQETNGHH